MLTTTRSPQHRAGFSPPRFSFVERPGRHRRAEAARTPVAAVVLAIVCVMFSFAGPAERLAKVSR